MWLVGRGSGMFEYFLPLFVSYSWNPGSNIREVDFEFEIVLRPLTETPLCI